MRKLLLLLLVSGTIARLSLADERNLVWGPTEDPYAGPCSGGGATGCGSCILWQSRPCETIESPFVPQMDDECEESELHYIDSELCYREVDVPNPGCVCPYS